jgi:sulfur transfer complex TusBCD TusB component (DsrH family)
MSTSTSSRKLTLTDIVDLRAYERERDTLRARVIDLKSRRRLSLGHIVTVTFENRETMRHQIQEMARVEKLITDEAIQEELDIYNPMVPEPGQLCATVFIELTSDEQMRLWLPKLVGIERSLVFRLPDGQEVRSVTEEQHETQLTRDDVTAAVHYVRFEFTDAQVAAFGDGTVLAIDHPAYPEEIELLPATVAELRTDLLP